MFNMFDLSKREFRNKVLGSLLGFAIGDAMGATTEFMTQKEIATKYGEVNDIIGGGWLNLKPGEVTDDTQMMTIVAKARMNGLETFTRDCCAGFVDWLSRGPKDVGGACKAAILQGGSKSPDEWMRLSMERQEASQRLDLGNGAVMRVLFLALLDEANLAVHQGRLTHNNPTSDMYIRDYCYAIFRALYFPECWAGEEGKPELLEPTGHVMNSVNNAIYWSFRARNFREAIMGPVNHGGDADTIAALTGGIAGAHFGENHIPRKWIETLDPHVVKDLQDMADWLMENQ